MEAVWTTLIFGALASGVILGKNKVEDEIIARTDSFTKWDALFKRYGGDDWPVLKAICMNESSLGDAPSVAHGLLYPSDIDASKSSDGKSWGLMQMTIPTARDYDKNANPVLLNNPEYSVRLAASFLRSLRRQFDELEFVVKSYNQGAGNSRKELNGDIDGYANEYWARFERNRKIILNKQGI